jgi:hypothetical protein
MPRDRQPGQGLRSFQRADDLTQTLASLLLLRFHPWLATQPFSTHSLKPTMKAYTVPSYRNGSLKSLVDPWPRSRALLAAISAGEPMCGRMAHNVSSLQRTRAVRNLGAC